MISQFREHFEKDFKNSGPSWLAELRNEGLKSCEALGLPDQRQEDWKYTNARAVVETPYQLGRPYQPDQINYDELKCVRFGKFKGVRLTFVNGHFAESLSQREGLPAGVKVQSLHEVLEKNPELIRKYLTRQASFEAQPFVALNTAFIQDGAFVYLPSGTVVENPIEIYFVSLANGVATVSHPRNLIVAESNSQATIVENYAGKKSERPYFTNAVTEIFVGEGAVIDHYKLQDEYEGAFHLASAGIRQERESSYTSHNISLGSAIARNEIHTLLGAEGADCTLNGLYMVHGSQHVDNQTSIDHAKPHCTSKELYKGILDDKSQGVFNGKILVRPNAQKTNARQTNNNLLLSREALVNTKPLLEIFANDVKCSHGATIGRLDENQLFYCRSRGLDEELARHLLTYAFASEVLQLVKIPSLQHQLEEILLNRVRIGELSVGGRE